MATDRETIREAAGTAGWTLEQVARHLDRYHKPSRKPVEICASFGPDDQLLAGALESDIGTHSMVHVNAEQYRQEQLDHLVGWF